MLRCRDALWRVYAHCCRCQTTDPVQYVGSSINHPYFFSISGSHADIWKVENVHTFHTRIGCV